MNVYTNNTFTGFYSVGSAAVVVAQDKQQAAYLLEVELERIHLGQKIDPNTMIQLPKNSLHCVILVDGNY